MAEGTKGTVVQVIGTVVDVEFPPDQLPAIYNAVEIDKNGTTVAAGGQQPLGETWGGARPTPGARRPGPPGVATGQPIAVPVGPKTLERLFDVLGRPLDNLGAVEADERWPIHRPPPTFEEPETH